MVEEEEEEEDYEEEEEKEDEENEDEEDEDEDEYQDQEANVYMYTLVNRADDPGPYFRRGALRRVPVSRHRLHLPRLPQRRANVADLYHGVRRVAHEGQEHVRALEVAEDDPLVVEEVEPRCDPRRDAQHPDVRAQPGRVAARRVQRGLERLAHELHYEARVVRCEREAERLHHVRVVPQVEVEADLILEVVPNSRVVLVWAHALDSDEDAPWRAKQYGPVSISE